MKIKIKTFVNFLSVWDIKTTYEIISYYINNIKLVVLNCQAFLQSEKESTILKICLRLPK